ncbi:MAG: hypothetical protein WAO35_09240 [Terriglobia bacterium]
MKGRGSQIWQVALALLTTAAFGIADTNSPPPGTLNYVEGQVSVQGQVQTQKSVGSTYLEPNQDLETGIGHAEMLLTPGVYVRLGDNSDVKMISPGLADTQVQLMKGSALLEVDELFKENNMSVVLDGTRTRLEKNGLYDFTANPASVKVLDGKAVTYEGDQHVNLKKGREVLLAEGQPLDVQKFDKNQVENDPLYRWSDLRSEYAANSNVQEGNALWGYGGWWGPGWYWDPFWMDFAWMPGWGMGWGAFGWPFFSPWAVGYAPYYGFGVGGRYYHYPVAMHADPRATGSMPRLANPVTRGAPGFRALPRSMAMNRGGMRGMAMGRMGGMRGGGFGGSGGFHGGTMGPRR